MDPVWACLVTGACCAVCAYLPAKLWAKREARVEQLEKENLEARRTIQALHRSMGLTETKFTPWPPKKH